MNSVNKMRNKSHMIISIKAEKVLDKTQQHFFAKSHFLNIDVEGTLYKTIKAIDQKHNTSILLNAFSLISGTT